MPRSALLVVEPALQPRAQLGLAEGRCKSCLAEFERDVEVGRERGIRGLQRVEHLVAPEDPVVLAHEARVLARAEVDGAPDAPEPAGEPVDPDAHLLTPARVVEAGQRSLGEVPVRPVGVSLPRGTHASAIRHIAQARTPSPLGAAPCTLRGMGVEDSLVRYVVREVSGGRNLADVMQDAYITNRAGQVDARRLLDRPEVIAAVNDDVLDDLRGKLGLK